MHVLITVAIAALLLLLVWARVDLEVACVRPGDEERTSWRLTVVGLFGLLRLQRAGPSASARGAAAERRSAPAEERRRRRFSLTPLLDGVVLYRAQAFLERALHRMRLRKLFVRGRVGLADPAATGMLWGMLFPLFSWAHARGAHVEIEPEFEGELVHGTVAVAVTMRPLLLLTDVGWLFASPVIWRALWRARCER